MKCLLRDLFANEDGGTMVEYGIVAALIALPSIAVLLAIANACGAVMNKAGTGLTSIGQTNP